MILIKHISILLLLSNSPSLLAMNQAGKKREPEKREAPAKKRAKKSSFRDEVFEELNDYFYPGEAESSLTNLYGAIVVRKLAEQYSKNLNQLFGLMRDLSSSPSMLNDRGHIMAHLRLRIEQLATHPKINKVAARNALLVLIYEETILLNMYFLKKADISQEEHRELGFHALRTLANIKESMDHFIHVGSKYNDDLQRLSTNTVVLGKNKSTKGEVPALFTKTVDENFIITITPEAQNNILVLYKDLIIEQLFKFDPAAVTYTEQVNNWISRGNFHLIENKKQLASHKEFFLVSIFPRLFLSLLERGKEDLLIAVNNYLDGYRIEERKKFAEIIADLNVIFADFRDEALNPASARTILPTLVGNSIQTVLAFFAQDDVKKNIIETYLNNDEQIPFEENSKVRHFHRYFSQLINYYLWKKSNNVALSKQVTEALNSDNKLLLRLIRTRIPQDILYNANNKDAEITQEEINTMNGIIADLKRLGLESTELAIFANLTLTLMLNNKEICHSIFWSPMINGRQHNSCTNFKDILLHPEQSDASLELRAKNFFLSLDVIWNSFAHLPQKDNFITELALSTNKGLCMELRHKSVDVAYQAIQQQPVWQLFANKGLVAKFSQERLLQLTSGYLQQHFAHYVMSPLRVSQDLVRQMPLYIQNRITLTNEQKDCILNTILNHENNLKTYGDAIENFFIKDNLELDMAPIKNTLETCYKYFTYAAQEFFSAHEVNDQNTDFKINNFNPIIENINNIKFKQLIEDFEISYQKWIQNVLIDQFLGLITCEGKTLTEQDIIDFCDAIFG